LDFSDDRLVAVLRALSDDDRWDAFEGMLNRRLLRVYDLNPERVRLDSTTASGYWTVTPGGLFQFGHSKDRRPDLPQVKVKLATLDPLGMPLVTAALSGGQADDPLYIPAIRRVRESLQRRGLLYIGDCKMAALETRAFGHAGDDFYLCEGYERLETLTTVIEGETITWTERRLVIRSLKRARATEKALRTRLAKAQVALAALNERRRGKKRFTEVEDLRQAAEAMVAQYRVEGVLRLSYQEIVRQRPVRRYRDRPATVRVEREVRVMTAVDEVAMKNAVRRLGWRVYATNAPPQQLPLTRAVLAYRSEYVIERGFGRLKGKPLSLTPMYLQRDDHATGLIRLLTIGLRVLTLLEFVVRRRLAAQDSELAGLYAGNPKRATARPTAERLLEAFQEVTLTIIQEPHQTRRHLTPFSKLQLRILALLDFPLDIYTRLCAVSSKPP